MAYKEKEGFATTKRSRDCLSIYASEADIFYALTGQGLQEKLKSVLTMDEFYFLQMSASLLFLRALDLGRKDTQQQIARKDHDKATGEARKQLIRELVRLLEEGEV